MKDTRIALCDIRGPLTDLIEKCSGENGLLWASALKKLLRKENAWVWEWWETITVGAHPSKKALLEALAAQNVKLEFQAQQYLQAVELEGRLSNLELVRLTFQDLGFESRREVQGYEHFCSKAAEKGLEICPDETAYQLALQCSYLEEPHTWRGRRSTEGIYIPIRQTAHFMKLYPNWEEHERRILLTCDTGIDEDATYIFAGRKTRPLIQA